MNREQILISLRELREQLPVDLINSQYSETIADDLAKQLVDVQMKLRNMTSSEVLNEPENAELKALELEFETARFEYDDTQREIASAESELVYIKDDLSLYQHRFERAKKLLTYVKSEEEIKIAQKRVDDLEDELKKIEEDIKTTEKNIGKFKDRLKENKAKLEEASKKLEEARQIELANLEKEHEALIAEASKNIAFMKTKAGFLSLDIAKVLDNLIEDYERGDANEREVNYRVNQIKDTLIANDQFDIFENEEAAIVYDQLDAYDTRIADLEAKIANDENYIMPEEEYQSKLIELKSTKRKMQNNFSAQNRRYQANLERLESIREEARDIGNLDETRLQQLLEESKRIEERNLGIQDRMDARREQITELDNEIADLTFLHNRPDLNAKAKDKATLDELKIARERMAYLDRLHKISLKDKLNTLLLGTGSKIEDLKEDENEKIIETPGPINPDDLNFDDISPARIAEEDKNLGFEPSESIPRRIDEKDKDLGPEPSIPGGTTEKDKGSTEPAPDKPGFPEMNAIPADAAPVAEGKAKFSLPESKLKKALKKWLPRIGFFLAGLILGSSLKGSYVTAKDAGYSAPATSITQKADFSVTAATLKRLNDLLDKCYSVDKNLYTIESYNAMMEKVYHIEELLKGVMSEDTCRQEIKELQELYNNLILIKDDTAGMKETDTKDGKEHGKSGDSGHNNNDNNEEEPEEPVVDPDEKHENNPDKIYLAPDDSAGMEGGGTVDYDGVQRDAYGNVIGEADVSHTPGGYTVVPTGEIPGPSEDIPVNNVPTGHETTDRSDLSEEANEELDRQVEEDLSNLDWSGFFGGPTASSETTSEPAL